MLLALLPEMVVFTDGRFLKVSTYQYQEGAYTLHLVSGGTVIIPEGRVEQILADEITRVPPPLPYQDPDLLRYSELHNPPDLPFWDITRRLAKIHDLHPVLISAIIHAESAFNQHAVSRKGAMGLMQLMPSTCRRYGVDNPFDPNQNIEGGARFLRYLKKKYPEELGHVLAAYNAGEHTVDRYQGPPPYRETIEFISRVNAISKQYLESSGSQSREHQLPASPTPLLDLKND